MADPVDRLEELRKAAGVKPERQPIVVGPAGHDPTKSRFEQALEWFRQRKEAHEKQRNEVLDVTGVDNNSPWRQLMRRCGRV